MVVRRRTLDLQSWIPLGLPSVLELLVEVARQRQGYNLGPLYEEGLQWVMEELGEQDADKIPGGQDLLGAFVSKATGTSASQSSLSRGYAALPAFPAFYLSEPSPA